jgi:hypothetical protein
VASLRSTELEDQWVYFYNKDKPLLAQAICKTDSGYIIGVLKQFTNGNYFGANFFEVSTQEKNINCHFKCRDRGLTEEVVDNKDNFVSFVSLIGWKPAVTSTFFKVQKESPFDTLNLSYVYDEENNYKYCLLEGENGSFKGCYHTEPNLEELTNFKNNFELSFSNVVTRENVAYSDVKIYHKSELKEKK